MGVKKLVQDIAGTIQFVITSMEDAVTVVNLGT